MKTLSICVSTRELWSRRRRDIIDLTHKGGIHVNRVIAEVAVTQEWATIVAAIRLVLVLFPQIFLLIGLIDGLSKLSSPRRRFRREHALFV